MPKRIVEIPLDDEGTVVLAELDEDEQAFTPATNLDKVAERFGGSVQAALDKTIKPTALLIMQKLRELQPTAVEVEFGLQLNGKAGAVFASAGTEAHVQITLTWDSKN